MVLCVLVFSCSTFSLIPFFPTNACKLMFSLLFGYTGILFFYNFGSSTNYMWLIYIKIQQSDHYLPTSSRHNELKKKLTALFSFSSPVLYTSFEELRVSSF